MSAFLGPIHHWLYNKVLWHEALLEEIYITMNQKGFDTKAIKTASEHIYGLPETAMLENVIDGNNIHGWLQLKIHSLEYRMAYVITKSIEKKFLTTEELMDVYYRNGFKAKQNEKEAIVQPEVAFKAIYDYLLEGMPCDRVNQPLTSDENNFTWSKRICIHQDFWEAVGGDINVYNMLRNQWIKAFVENEFEFGQVDELNFKISRRAS